MRAYRLLRIALQAETLRWRSAATRIVMRLVFGAVALLFLTGMLVFAHLAAWVWLRSAQAFNPYEAAGILAGVDLLVAILFGFLATRSTPSRVELEALEVRRHALQSITTSLSLVQLVLPILRMTRAWTRRSRT